MVDRRASGQAANGKDTVISLRELLSSNAAKPCAAANRGRPKTQAHVNLAAALVGKGNWKKRVPPSLVSRCYGSGAPLAAVRRAIMSGKLNPVARVKRK